MNNYVQLIFINTYVSLKIATDSNPTTFVDTVLVLSYHLQSESCLLLLAYISSAAI